MFICFADHQFLGHINERLNDLFSNGFAVSDTALFRLAKDRFPADVIKQMMEDDGQQDAK